MSADLGVTLPWTADDAGNLYATTPAGREHIGVMMTPGLAGEAHNDRLAARRSGGTVLRGLTGVQIGDGGIQNNRFSGA